MMNEFVEKEAKSVEEAKSAVADELGCSPGKIEFEILEGGSRGFFGIGKGRPARVRGRRIDGAENKETAETPSAGAPGNEADEARPTDAADAGARPDLGEAAELGVRFLSFMVGYISDKARIERRDADKGILLDIVGDESGLLIGRRGQTLDALQYLTNKMVGKARTGAGGAPGERIVVDASGYRERRAESLDEMARRMAAKVRNTGKAISVDPLPPAERRLLHIALENEPGVRTESRGEGEYRRLRIMPTGRDRRGRP